VIVTISTTIFCKVIGFHLTPSLVTHLEVDVTVFDVFSLLRVFHHHLAFLLAADALTVACFLEELLYLSLVGPIASTTSGSGEDEAVATIAP